MSKTNDQRDSLEKQAVDEIIKDAMKQGRDFVEIPGNLRQAARNHYGGMFRGKECASGIIIRKK